MIAVDKINVGLVRATSYQPELITQKIDALFSGVGFRPASGAHVLLKPNLVAPAMLHDLACTHPEFVGGVAQWFLDHGCKVSVGDSPASGSCCHAMEIVGLDKVVQKLGLRVAPFAETVRLKLHCGVTVAVCRDVLDCDLLVNLHNVKSHSLVRVTLAVKNYFGMVKGWRKAMAHQVHGGGDAASFIDILCDLPQVVPPGISLCDGIVAMHVTGPMAGKPYPLNLMGCSVLPQALDVSLLEILGVMPSQSPLWARLNQRGVYGNELHDVHFPLLCPADLAVDDFIVPPQLKPVRFGVGHVVKSVVNRLQLRLGV
jgi:uncharacterized protein (DUF362 family)